MHILLHNTFTEKYVEKDTLMVRYKLYILALVSYSLLSWNSLALAREKIDANTQPLFDACMNRCDRTDILGNLTREGCVKGCEQIRRTFPLTEKSYSSYASCLEDTKDIELTRDLLIEKYQEWCGKTYDHIHKKKGCKDAVETYINAISYETVCTRGNTATAKTNSLPTVTTPTPIQEKAIAQTPSVTKKQASSPKAIASPKIMAKASTPIVQAKTVTPTKESPSIINKTNTSLPQVSMSKLSSSPSMKPLFTSKKETQPSLLSRNTSSAHQDSSLSNTMKKNTSSAIPASISPKTEIVKNNSMANSALNSNNASITKAGLKAPTISTKNAMPSSATMKKNLSSREIQQEVSSQAKTSTQVTQGEDKKASSQKTLSKKTESLASQKRATTTKEAKQTVTPPVPQPPITIQQQAMTSVSSQDTALVNTPPKAVTPPEEKSPQAQATPQSQPSSNSVAVVADNKKIAQETVKPQTEPAETTNAMTTAAAIESKPRRSPELEKLINDVHAEMESSEKNTQPPEKKQATIAPTLPSATLSSPIASLGSLSLGASTNVVPQQKSNATTRVQEEKKNTTQQTQDASSLQLTRRLRQAPQDPPQPYGLSLPASAVKAPPAPMP